MRTIAPLVQLHGRVEELHARFMRGILTERQFDRFASEMRALLRIPAPLGPPPPNVTIH